MWDRAVSCGTEQSHVGNTSLIWDIAVSCGTNQYNFEASTTSEEYPGPPGTPINLWKSYKNIYNLERHSGASTTSEECPGPPGTPVVL